MNFGTILKNLMDEHKLTQSGLAVAIGYTQRAISKWVNEQAEPTETAIKKIADYFGVSTDYLLGRTEDDFGSMVTPSHSSTAPALTAKEQEILRLYNALNPSGKELIEQTLKTLSDTALKNL